MEIPRLLLLRHGQSTWNEEGRWQGIADPPLSDRGQAEAGAIADYLGEFEFAGIFASDLLRARQTAQAIADKLGLRIEIDTNLRERDVGEWSGLTSAEIFERWPDVKRRKDEGLPLQQPNEQTERYNKLVQQTIEAYRDSLKAGPVLVVTHGGFIRSLERSIDGQVTDRVPNLSGRWIEFRDDGMRLGDLFLIEGFHSSPVLDNIGENDSRI